jgi:hypothetical protein
MSYGTLQEDFEKMGLGTQVGATLALSGVALTEDAPVAPGAVAPAMDPIDGPVVTLELFDRIVALPFDAMSAADCDALLEGLAAKDLPEGDAALRARAEEVVGLITEKRQKIRTLHGMKSIKIDTSSKGKMARLARRKAYRSNKGGVKSKARRVRKTSAFKLHLKKFAKKWGAKNPISHKGVFAKAHAMTGGSKRSAGKMLSKGFGRLAADADSEIASNLRGVLHESRVQSGLRAEVVERLNAVFGLLSEMCASDNVDEVLAEAIIPVNDRAAAGTLTEDTLDDGEFVAALAPCLNVVRHMMEGVEAGQHDFDYSALLAEALEGDDEEDDDLGN